MMICKRCHHLGPLGKTSGIQFASSFSPSPFSKTVFLVNKNFLVDVKKKIIFSVISSSKSMQFKRRSNSLGQQAPLWPFTFCYLNLVSNSARSSDWTSSAGLLSILPCSLLCTSTENGAQRIFLAEPNFAANPSYRCAARTIESAVCETFPQPWIPSHSQWTWWRERFWLLMMWRIAIRR